jgi:hypothetical protein
MPSSKKLISAAFFCLLMTLCMAMSAKADSTYTFTGADFNQFSNTSCEPTCSITGSVTLLEALPPDLVQGIGDSGDTFPSSFSFTDGSLKIDNLNAAFYGFSFDTDSAGNITNYNFYADLADGSSLSGYFNDSIGVNELYTANNSAGYDAYIEGDGISVGTWGPASTPAPEPSSLMMLGVGLLGLVGIGLKRSLLFKLPE